MSQVDTRAQEAEASLTATPRVLVVLVTHQGARTLPGCLLALSRQSYPRIGVIAVDDASSDGSVELLESALGRGRVVRLPTRSGFAAAVDEALRSTAAGQADCILLLHDHTILHPGAVGALVDAARRVEGTGVVGPKVLGWGNSAVLREIGMSIDRFAAPYSPLEEGEIDQGQYDRIREVMYVSSSAMLVLREAMARIGPLDGRFPIEHEDLDLCWRARLAGYRVLMAPAAVARHDERSHTSRSGRPSRERYELERSALGAMLKNYGLVSLAWVIPLYAVASALKVLWFAGNRRFEEAYQVVAGWGWNLAHLAGTLARRRRAQSIRRVRDHAIVRSMAPATIRLRRWAVLVGQTLVLGRRRAEDVVETAQVSTGRRAALVVLSHPAAAAWVLGIGLALIAYRGLLGSSPLTGGALGAVPGSPIGYFNEFLSGLRTTGLGGADAASPAIALLGLGSVLSWGSTALFQKLLLLILPMAAAVGCYRAVRANLGEQIPAVVSAVAYGLSATVLWAFSEGRIDALVFLAGLPWLGNKLALAFRPSKPVTDRRWVVGTGLGLAVLMAFLPGAVLAAAVLVISLLLVPPPGGRRVRGLALIAPATFISAILLFPLVPGWTRGGGSALADPAGEASFAALARFSLGRGPGSWVLAFYLPAVAALALGFASGDNFRLAARLGIGALGGLYLAWLASAGYLPTVLSNPVAYIGVSALECALLAGVGVAFVIRRVPVAAFGHTQVVGGILLTLLAVGLGGQALQALGGSWTVGGEDRIPAAYPLLSAEDPTSHRVMWLGSPSGEAFPAPGGLPEGKVAAGAASVRFAVRSPQGASVLDLARPSEGRGYDFLRQALSEILAGSTRHGGALLAPFGIRYVVADPADLPDPALGRLIRQVDLDVLPAGGLTILQNQKAIPMAAWMADPGWEEAATTGRLADLVRVGSAQAARLGGGPQRYRSVAPGTGMVLLSQQFAGSWSLSATGKRSLGKLAFGWAIRFPTDSADAAFTLRFGNQALRTVQSILLGALWLGALWMTRRHSRSAA